MRRVSRLKSNALAILQFAAARQSAPMHKNMRPALIGLDEAVARFAPGTVTVPLCSHTNASRFWIILLLIWGRLERGVIRAATPCVAPPGIVAKAGTKAIVSTQTARALATAI
jgi:hypothetical protein